MPTENENPIDNLFDSTNNEPAVSLDVTQFNIPDGHVEVTIEVDGELTHYTAPVSGSGTAITVTEATHHGKTTYLPNTDEAI